MRDFWTNRRNITQDVFYLYPFFKETHLQVRLLVRYYTLNGTNDADSRKDVPFLALVDIAAHLGDQIDQKPQFWGHK